VVSDEEAAVNLQQVDLNLLVFLDVLLCCASRT